MTGQGLWLRRVSRSKSLIHESNRSDWVTYSEASLGSVAANLTNRTMSKSKIILSLFGTRPEVIKLAPVIRQLELRKDQFETINVTSGQHRELL